MVQIASQELRRLIAQIRRGLEAPNNNSALSLAKINLRTLEDYAEADEVVPPLNDADAVKMQNAQIGTNMTSVDKEMLAEMPSGKWFNILDLPYVIRNPAFRCKRLVKAGVLESRVVGEFPNIKTEYWKKH